MRCGVSPQFLRRSAADSSRNHNYIARGEITPPRSHRSMLRIDRCERPSPPGEGQVKYNLKMTASDCTRKYRVIVEPRLSRLRGGPRMPGRYRWRFPSVTLTLVSRSCVARQEPYIPGALSIL